MKRRVGARGLAIAVLVLAAIVATPAFSAAQETDTTTTEDPSLIAPPPEQVVPDDGASDEGGEPARTDETVTTEPPPAAVPRSAEGDAVAHASASATVSIGDNFYSPASVSVAVGDTVTWANNGQAQHSATADDGSFDTGVFGPGGTRSKTFNQAGTFSYFCTVHGQSQSGTVRVLAASGGGNEGGGGSAGSSGAGNSEAAAVASPDAAGTSTSLAATGLEALGLATIGLALLIGGIALRRRAGLGYRPPLV
jgi:plastocyanin